ncbi:MAG: hypothetical protein JEZ00_16840 [Anaerolineaceae bacterium]|nr:hypothetical protein [Anaerolineaceae bacterium]
MIVLPKLPGYYVYAVNIDPINPAENINKNKSIDKGIIYNQLAYVQLILPIKGLSDE